MADRKIRTISEIVIAAIVITAIASLFLGSYFTSNKGDTRIIQMIQPQSDCRTYTITTHLQHFNKQWHTIATWETNGPISVIITIKTSQQSEAEERQRGLKRGLKRFYDKRFYKQP